MADEVPAPPPVEVPPDATPAATPLDQAPLGEFIARRGKGEQQPPAESGETDESAEPTEPATPGSKAPPVKKDFKSRFDQIYRQRSDAIRERDAEKAKSVALEERLRALETQLQQRPASPPPTSTSEPTPPPLQADRPPLWDEWQ